MLALPLGLVGREMGLGCILETCLSGWPTWGIYPGISVFLPLLLCGSPHIDKVGDQLKLLFNQQELGEQQQQQGGGSSRSSESKRSSSSSREGNNMSNAAGRCQL